MRRQANGTVRGAIFDLDGTLADTAADLLAAANAVLGPRGLPLLDLARDRAHAGRGGRSMVRRSLSLLPEPPDAAEVEALADALYPDLLGFYEARLAEETRLYDGVIPCLEALAQAGWRLGVCTNKPDRLALALLERLGVRDRFAAVLGAGSLPVIKPDPEHLRETVRRAGAVPERSVMLGDTSTDLLAARAAGLRPDALRLRRRAARGPGGGCRHRPLRRGRAGTRAAPPAPRRNRLTLPRRPLYLRAPGTAGGRLAQLVEHSVHIAGVAGSSPAPPTTQSPESCLFPVTTKALVIPGG